MDDKAWLAAGAVLAAIVGALWNTGGRAAIQRRAIKQELDIAEALPYGAVRREMYLSAEEKSLKYAVARYGPGITGRQLVAMGVVLFLSVVAILGSVALLDSMSSSNTWYGFVSVLVVTTFLASVGLTVAFVAWFARDQVAELRAGNLSSAKSRIDRIRKAR